MSVKSEQRQNLKFKSVGLSQFTTCGLTLNGALYCWGNVLLYTDWIDEGLDLYETHSFHPTLMNEGPFEKLVMTGRSLCVQKPKSQQWLCMGEGNFGELGNGELEYQDELVEVTPPISFSTISSTFSVGYGSVVCGVDTEHKIWCWGGVLGHRGEFGQPYPYDSSRVSIQKTPQRTAWDDQFVDLHAKFGGFCGVTADRKIRCWGDNSHCGLGQHAPEAGVVDYYFKPQPPVEGIPEDWKELSGQCVLSDEGDIWCWGLNKPSEDPVRPIRCEPTAQRMLTF